jgi:hypothetical protein
MVQSIVRVLEGIGTSVVYKDWQIALQLFVFQGSLHLLLFLPNVQINQLAIERSVGAGQD